jgi:hypothetical protein
MTDDAAIEITSVTSDPESGGDAVNIQVRFGKKKKAIILLKPGKMLQRMSDADWREELRELADALHEARVSSVLEQHFGRACTSRSWRAAHR